MLPSFTRFHDAHNMMHTIFYEPGGRFFRDRFRTPTTSPSPRKLRAATPTILYASGRFIVSARQ